MSRGLSPGCPEDQDNGDQGEQGDGDEDDNDELWWDRRGMCFRGGGREEVVVVVVVLDMLSGAILQVVHPEIRSGEVACVAEEAGGAAVAEVLVLVVEGGGCLVWHGSGGRRWCGCGGGRGLGRIPRFSTRAGRIPRTRALLHIASGSKV